MYSPFSGTNLEEMSYSWREDGEEVVRERMSLRCKKDR